MTTFGNAMVSTQSEKYYSIMEAARMIGCDYSTLQKACKDGKISDVREMPASHGRGSTFMISEFRLREWDKTRRRRTDGVKPSELTIEELAEELINRIQKAYDDGYKAGRKDQRSEMLNALKGVQ